MKTILFMIFACLVPSFGAAQSFEGADIVFLGEVHDNPLHHKQQAAWVQQISPRALVFEMLTARQAQQHIPGGGQEALSQAFEWDASGWPDFAMYYPIFSAAPDARVYGAGVPRQDARRVGQEGLAAVFGDAADRFGLGDDLPADQQAEREALQMAAHCNALPEHLLPMMVSIQRLRDASLAQAAVLALQQTGGPVAVITGNGHARADWGAPALVGLAAPDARVLTFGQGETGADGPDGGFDAITFAAAPERADPCAAFN